MAYWLEQLVRGQWIKCSDPKNTREQVLRIQEDLEAYEADNSPILERRIYRIQSDKN